MSGPCWYYRGGSCPTHGDQGWWKTREELCLPSSRLLVQEYTISGKAKYKEVTAVTTLPAKAGSFWLVPEAPVSAGASRATLTAPRYVNARRLRPSPLERASTIPRDGPHSRFFSLYAGGCERNPNRRAPCWTQTVQVFPGSLPARTRTSIIAFVAPSYGATTAQDCQALGG